MIMDPKMRYKKGIACAQVFIRSRVWWRYFIVVDAMFTPEGCRGRPPYLPYSTLVISRTPIYIFRSICTQNTYLQSVHILQWFTLILGDF